MAGAKIIVDSIGGGGTDKNGTVFAAFAANNEFATFEVDGIAI